MYSFRSLVVMTSALYISTAVALSIRLALSGLFGRYKILGAFLIADSIQTALPLLVRYNTTTYGVIYFATEVALWILYFMIVVELFGRVLSEFQTLSEFARWLVGFLLPMALLLALPAFTPMWRSTPAPIPFLQIFYFMHRTVVLSLVIFLLLIVVILVRYAIVLSPNSWAYAMAYSIFFTTKGIAVAIVSEKPAAWALPVYTASQIVAICCFAYLLATLRAKGEAVEPATTPAWRSGEAERLLNELRNMNAFLRFSAKLEN